MSIVALTLYGNLLYWRKLTESQFRIDHCVEKTALSLKNNLESIESSNRRMSFMRMAKIAGTVLPSALPALDTALKAESIYQQALLRQWDLIRTEWTVKRCGSYWDRIGSIPAAPWIREPPDPLGPRPLRWLESAAREFHIETRSRSRFAAAKINGNEKYEWEASWAPHSRLQRAGAP